ncbi:MAG: hypothetical protein WCG95_01950 [bacterium]
MNITPKDTTNIKKRMYGRHATQTSSPLSVSITYKRELLKLNSQNLSFTGSFINNVSGALEEYGKQFGPAAKKKIKEQLALLSSKKNPFLTLKDNSITFKKMTALDRLNQAVIDPVVHMPVDLANSTLNLIKKIPAFKNSNFIDNLLANETLKNRRSHIENISHAAGIEHFFEMLDNETLKSRIFNEGHKRLSTKVSNYSTKSERALTRFVTGMIPAFFLANDAYNLSTYVNNDKSMAKEEKKRRFKQEMARVIITAAATFGFLGYFAKKSNSSHDSATTLIATLTFASEIIGRIIAGVPFYPISEKAAKKYAKLRHQEQTQNANSSQNFGNNTTIQLDKPQKYAKINKKDDPKSFNVLNLLGGMVALGFLVDLARKKTHPIGIRLDDIIENYAKKFEQDVFMPKKEIEALILKLKENGFDGIAKNYETTLAKLPTDKNNPELVKIGTEVNKTKNIIVNQILALPIKFAWEVLMMPYRTVVKPLFELSRQGLAKIKLVPPKIKEAKKEKITSEHIFKNGIQFLKKISQDVDFEDKVNKNLIESFDNVNKSNFSNAELSGAAKTAVSTVTSGFLIADNYNLVMIDSNGEEKDLAKQKAKERTVQRIARIAYGATLIKLSNGIFKVPFNNSLLEAQAVNILTTGVIETLERKSVGLPLSESTREDMIENDEKNANAKGFRGAYYRFMSKLTGKKSLAEMKTDKK